MIESIANGEFDINNLVKLHREEEVRNRHIKTATEGVFQPLDKTRSSEVITSFSKLHKVFRDLPSFLGAWSVYASIRSSYSPERGPGLLLFVERIVFHCSLNYPWNNVFNYILAFFRAHQNSHPDVWNDVDSNLVSNYLAVTQQRTASVPASRSLSSRFGKSVDSTPTTQQVCHNWNRMHTSCKKTDCLRRHVCAICEKDGHRSWQCPTAAPH